MVAPALTVTSCILGEAIRIMATGLAGEHVFARQSTLTAVTTSLESDIDPPP